VPEPLTSGGPGREAVDAAALVRGGARRQQESGAGPSNQEGE
jgi:hypothetical protein